MISAPVQRAPIDLGGGIACLPAFVPIPEMGVLPANSFVIDGDEPMIVDTGIPPLADDFQAAVRAVIDPARVKWIWLTHMDADHLGGLPALLGAAPKARIVTSFLGVAKLGLLGLLAERAHVIAPGDEFLAGGRRLLALRPPSYDAPETMGLWDEATATLFSADSFAALLAEPLDDAAALADEELHDGTLQWATIDLPWLADMDLRRFAAAMAGFAGLGARTVLSSHLPPARGMTGALLANLAAVQRELAHLDEIGLSEAA